ncbi:EAL domain-containing protein [Halorhodospira halochloris]|uniref:putative bifunctional diguanylate cyclase/phosphodiesterase n=1 Tax=Halorhodospira halochloris TaxID=1052 RepID=UPI001EE89CE1|nr:bifunctional diguanylate cyclase/phosphodiesterase [Halorhodospira halochloris]MCG5531025.1 EAL domain-containing protein [Halorhodospira halochloris]
MRPAPIPENEDERLAALHEYGLLDTPPEDAFERITTLLCNFFDLPIATITLVDNDRQWFKSYRGLDDCQTPRDISFCGHVVASGEPLIVEDATADERFHDNPLVTSERGIRFYAGVPLTTPSGYHIGVLSIQDPQARKSDAICLQSLQDFAALVVDELELRLQSAKRQLELRRFAGGPTVVFAWDQKSGEWPVRYVSPNVQRVLGYSPEQLIGRPFAELVHPEDYPRLIREDSRALSVAVDSYFDYTPYRVKAADSAYRWVQETSVFERNGRGDVVAGLGYINDITERVELEEQNRTDRSELIYYRSQLEELLHTDPLTELPNRLLLHDRLAQAVERRKRDKAALAVLVLDLRDFRAINDSLGKDFGDQVLINLGRRLKQVLRVGDTVARLGGDEFGILLPWLGVADDSVELVERLVNWVEEPLFVGDQEICLVARVGISVYPTSGSEENLVTRLLEQADTAMHEAKREGVRYRFFSAELTDRAHERLKLAADLRRALANNRLLLHYQPQVDLKSGSWVGVEALARWFDPQQGWISPARFIPVAERSGLIDRLGEWVLDTACAQAVIWLQQGIDFGRISVNVAAPQMAEEGWAEKVKEALERTGLPPHKLELEITESLLVERMECVTKGLSELRALGVAVAVDDFGTGYSALSYLKDLPVDNLKIDRSFIRDYPGDRHAAAIARAIIALGTGLGIRVIAEGVETEMQRKALLDAGCRQGQGFLFHVPEPAASFG